jgi:hypothetical protein
MILLALLMAACGAAEPLPTEEPIEPEPTLAPEEPTEPEPTLAPEQPVATPTLASAVPTPSPTPIVEERSAELEWPGSMRVGDGEVIRLSLVSRLGGAYVVTPEIEGHQVETTTVPLPVARPGYEGYLSASLTAAGLEVVAAGPTEQPLQPGGSNTWHWTISAAAPGTYRPVVNVTARWEPRLGSSASRRLEEVVWSRVLTVEARPFLGLSGPHVDVLGLGGSVLGTVAGIPFLEKALIVLWKRLKRRRPEGKPEG